MSIIKVVWICHFSNEEIQSKLKVKKKIGSLAPWIPTLIDFFNDSKSVELYIISPHRYLSRTKTINYKGVPCYFFNPGIPFWGRHWPKRFEFDLWTNFYFNSRKIKKIVKKIKPDIIHLHGAENSYYSSSIFQFKDKYPILITIQGFLSLMINVRLSKSVKERMEVEQTILKTFKNFGYRTKTMGDEILKFNSNAKLYWHQYPLKKILVNNNVDKVYDCVFFARVVKEKGIEDLLQAISILKDKNDSISLLVIGESSSMYKQKLLKLCEEYGISSNVTWAGFLPTQEDVHEQVEKAKITVLPVYSEIISGTIIESMFLKIPVVAYDVGSIHEVNANGNYITLVKSGDINSLANEIRKLIEDDSLLKQKSQKVYLRAKEMFGNDRIYSDLFEAYQSIIQEFKKS